MPARSEFSGRRIEPGPAGRIDSRLPRDFQPAWDLNVVEDVLRAPGGDSERQDRDEFIDEVRRRAILPSDEEVTARPWPSSAR